MFNPIEFVSLPDRYPTYKKLRDEAPVLQTSYGGAPIWLITRYDDVSSILRDATARVKPLPGSPNPAGLSDGAAKTFFDAVLVLNDPPEHDRLRKLAQPAFTAAKVAPIQQWFQETVETRVALLAERDSFDFVQDFAAYLPALTIFRILNIPHADWDALTSRVPAFLHIFSPFPIDAAQLEACNAACAFYMDYIGALIDDRRSTPGDDIVGTLISAHEDGDRLSHTELVVLLHAFLAAGIETTTSALSSGMWGMLSQRTPWQQLAANPSLAPQALEEILRWDAPVSFLRRYPSKDTVVQGVTLKAGEPVLLGLASANRDERRFDQPDTIDIHRERKDHLSFGGGRHFCLGIQLAKMEARTAIESLARLLPQLELIDEQPVRQADIMFHSLKHLQVAPGAPLVRAHR